MTDWGIERLWELKSDEGERKVSTSELVGFGACGLLGAAGLGKTYELTSLQESLVRDGVNVLKKRFVEIGPGLTAESLRRGLTDLSNDLDSGTVLLLDALDEAMIPIRMIGTVVADWIRSELRVIRPSLLISCRSAVWPDEIRKALQDAYRERVGMALLQPISREQQKAAAVAESVTDCDSFFQGIAKARVEGLAEQPMTLRLLIDEFKRSGTMPTDRCELFDRVVNELVLEREERHVSGGVSPFSPEELLKAGERLACLSTAFGSTSCITR